MRKTTALIAVLLVGILANTGVEALKKPTAKLVAVDATFSPATPASDPTQVAGGPYSGTVALDGGFQLDSMDYAVEFAPGTFDTCPDPLTPAPGGGSDAGVSFSMTTHNVGKLTSPAMGAMAGQATLRWTGQACNGGTYTYTLQYGDAYDSTIDYAHITCAEADSAGCTRWIISSLVTYQTPTGDVTSRDTGPTARLSVTTGRGSKGVVSLGLFEVPFSITLVRRP